MWLQVENGVYKSDFQERLVLEILKGDTSSRKINKKNEVNEAVCYYNLSKYKSDKNFKSLFREEYWI